MKIIKMDYTYYDDGKPLGTVIENYVGYFNRPPEGYIEYIPNRIYDRRKYKDFYNLFYKDRLPNETELKCYMEKMNYYEQDNNNWKILLTFMIFVVLLFIYTIIIILMEL